MKLHRNSKRTFNSPLKLDKKELYATTDDVNKHSLAQTYCLRTKFYTSLRKKINYFLDRIYRPKCVYHQANLHAKIPQDMSSTQKAPEAPTKLPSPAGQKKSNYLKQTCLQIQKIESNNLYMPHQTKRNNYTRGPQIKNPKKNSKCDIFIVYNKLDSDLVHNVITPILRGKLLFLD